MHPTLPLVYLTFWLLSRLQIALLIDFHTIKLLSAYRQKSAPGFCLLLADSDCFSSWVRVVPEAGRPPMAQTPLL